MGHAVVSDGEVWRYMSDGWVEIRGVEEYLGGAEGAVPGGGFEEERWWDECGSGVRCVARGEVAAHTGVWGGVGWGGRWRWVLQWGREGDGGFDVECVPGAERGAKEGGCHGGWASLQRSKVVREEGDGKGGVRGVVWDVDPGGRWHWVEVVNDVRCEEGRVVLGLAPGLHGGAAMQVPRVEQGKDVGFCWVVGADDDEGSLG